MPNKQRDFSFCIRCHPVFAALCACLQRPPWRQYSPWKAPWSKNLWDLCKSVHSFSKRCPLKWYRRWRCLLHLLLLGEHVSVSAWAAPSQSQRAAGPCSIPPPEGPQWTSGLREKLKGQRSDSFVEEEEQLRIFHLWTQEVLPRRKARTPWCSPLVWQVSFLPGSSFIMARFWFQWHQFTSSTLIHQ